MSVAIVVICERKYGVRWQAGKHVTTVTGTNVTKLNEWMFINCNS